MPVVTWVVVVSDSNQFATLVLYVNSPDFQTGISPGFVTITNSLTLLFVKFFLWVLEL